MAPADQVINGEDDRARQVEDLHQLQQHADVTTGDHHAGAGFDQVPDFPTMSVDGGPITQPDLGGEGRPQLGARRSRCQMIQSPGPP